MASACLGGGEEAGPSSAVLADQAQRVLRLAERHGYSIATADSCTGGLVASLLSVQPGYGKWFERDFAARSEASKRDLLGVPAATIREHGAVSRQVATSLAVGALMRSNAGIALGITGLDRADGPEEEAGLVFLAVADRRGHHSCRECHFGELGRDRIRDCAALTGLRMLETMLRGRFELEMIPGASMIEPVQNETVTATTS